MAALVAPLKKEWKLVVALAALVVLVAGGCWARHNDSAKLALARHAETTALAATAVAQTQAAVAQHAADSLRGLAQRKAASAPVHAADSAAGAFAAAAALSPVQCVPAIHAAQVAIIEEDSVASTYHSALEDALAADSARTKALAVVEPALTHLQATSAILVNDSRPSLLSRIAPQVGVGAAAGYDPIRHQAAVVIGVTLGYHF